MPFVAHPLTEPGGLSIPPLVAAVLAMLLVTAVARLWPGPNRAAQPDGDRLHSWWGRLSRLQVAGRVHAFGLLVLGVVAGRVGEEDELANLAPALVVGTAWPVVLLGCAVLGSVWRWLDPWDGPVRIVQGRPESEAAPAVWWALVPALAWSWFLGAFADTLDPRNVGLALGLYSAVVIAGCLWLGRAVYLSRAEPFGLLFGWTARLPRGLLPDGVLHAGPRRSWERWPAGSCSGRCGCRPWGDRSTWPRGPWRTPRSGWPPAAWSALYCSWRVGDGRIGPVRRAASLRRRSRPRWAWLWLWPWPGTG